MTKRLVAVLGLVILAVVLVAASAQAGRKTQKVTNVTFAGWSSGPDEDALDTQMANAFNNTVGKREGIHVSWQVINGDYAAAMTARFAAHNAPDVFYVDSSVIGSWIKQGVIAPLNGLIKKTHFNTKPFYPKLLGAFKKGSTIYGFPKDWSPLATEINNSLFARAGLKKAPKTWAQLKSDARTLQQHGVAHPICLSADWARMGAFMYQNGGSITKNLTSKANRQAVNFYVGLIKSGLAYTPPAGSWCGQELGQSHAAIIFEGNWLLPYMPSTYPNTHFSVAPMIKGKQQGNLAFTVSWSIAKSNPNKAAAWKVLSWLVGKQGEKIWMSKGLALSPRKDVASKGGRKPFLAAAPYARGWGFGNPHFANAYTIMGNDLNAVISGNKTTQQMLADVGKALKGK
ncbi:MAG TPA: extracellular solute-binding protein [Gaiellaceae bacterium]|nr:extracellular solute-binding protein [Gaiellaceae bacterium]